MATIERYEEITTTKDASGDDPKLEDDRVIICVNHEFKEVRITIWKDEKCDMLTEVSFDDAKFIAETIIKEISGKEGRTHES